MFTYDSNEGSPYTRNSLYYQSVGISLHFYIKKFCCTGSVLTQRNGCTGRPVIMATNANQGRLIELPSTKKSKSESSSKIFKNIFKQTGGFVSDWTTFEKWRQESDNRMCCASILAMVYMLLFAHTVVTEL